MLVGTLLLLLVTATPQAHAIPTEDLGVEGVEIGTLRSKVIRTFGQPVKIEKGHDYDMGMGDSELLHYPGLLVDVISPPKSNAPEFYVTRIVLTGPKWSTRCGLRIGMSPAETERLLGLPDTVENEGAELRHFYETEQFQARVLLRFKHGKLVELTVQEDWS